MKARPLRARRASTTDLVSLITQLSIQKVDTVIQSLFAVACAELKKNGTCNFISMVRLRLKKNGTCKAFALRKFKLRLADELRCHWLR